PKQRFFQLDTYELAVRQQSVEDHGGGSCSAAEVEEPTSVELFRWEIAEDLESERLLDIRRIFLAHYFVTHPNSLGCANCKDEVEGVGGDPRGSRHVVTCGRLHFYAPTLITRRMESNRAVRACYCGRLPSR